MTSKLTAFSGQIFSKLSKNDHPTNLLAMRLVVAFFSALLTILAIATDDVINMDGVLYVNMAYAFLENGLTGTASMYDWPFYSIIAAGLSSLTGLSTLSSYYLLNTVLFVLVTDSFFLLSSKQLKTGKQLSISALIILCLFSLNEYRDFIIRDVGYWAFSLYALYSFINYSEEYKFRSLFLWQSSLILATLFRIEGIILLLVLPLFMLLKKPFKQNIKSIFYSYIWLLIVAVIILANQLWGGNDFNAFSKITDVTTYLDGFKQLTFFSNASQLIDSQILATVVQDQGYGEIILASGFITITLFEIISALSIPYLLLLIMSSPHAEKSLQSKNSRFFLLVLFIQFSLLLVFFLTKQIQTTRYCLFAGMVLLIWCLPALTTYILEVFKHKRMLPMIGICLIFTYSIADAFHHSSSKQYFVNDLTSIALEIPDNETVMTNNKLIGFYLNQSKPSLNILFDPSLRLSRAETYLVIEPHRTQQKNMSRIDSLYNKNASLGTSKRPILFYEKK